MKSSSDDKPRELLAWRTMFGLREKLSLCFAGLLIIVMALGAQSVYHLNALGTSIDQILQENFETVVASDDMIEGIGRMDSGILFWLLGYHADGMKDIERGRRVFDSGFAICDAQVTHPASRQRLLELRSNFAQCDALIETALASSPRPGLVDTLYVEELKPLFARVHTLAGTVQELNQSNMVARHGEAELRADSAKWQTLGVLGIALILASAAIYFSGRWLLLPIIHLTHAAEEIRTGHLDARVPVTSEDELGILVQTFMDMAEQLHRFNRTQKSRLLKSSTATMKIMDNLTDAIALATPDGDVEMASRVAGEVFDIRTKMNLSEARFPWIADMAERAVQLEDTVFGESDHEIVQAFLDGEEHFFFPSAVAIYDDEDFVSGILLFFRDITDIRIQQELKQDAIATVSHQLKTPLTSIQMALHMLNGGKFGPINEKQRELLNTACEESERLLRMVLSLLDMSRIKSGRVMLECASTSLRTMISTFVNDVHSAAEKRGVAVKVDLDEHVPEVWVDQTRIEHVFNNLLGNGISYSPEGSELQITAAVETDWVQVDVQDSGPGIAAEECEHVFEQFYRGAGSDTISGAGLGLYIAKQIVEAHGGHIEVEGGVGTGACFSVWLPRADAAERLGLLDQD